MIYLDKRCPKCGERMEQEEYERENGSDLLETECPNKCKREVQRVSIDEAIKLLRKKFERKTKK
jgi:DNA-binding protein YbaB